MRTFKESIEVYIEAKELELFAAQVDKACIEEDFKTSTFLPDQEQKATKLMLGAAKAKEQMCLRQIAMAKKILEEQGA